MDGHSHQQLPGGGGAGVEHVDVHLRVLLLQQDAGLFGAVVGAAEQGSQGDHIHVAGALVGVQIGLGGGAGGGGRVLALAHGPQQVRLVKGLIVHKGAAVGGDRQRHLDKNGVLQHGGGQVAAAVDYNFKTHVFHLQTWSFKLDSDKQFTISLGGCKGKKYRLVHSFLPGKGLSPHRPFRSFWTRSHRKAQPGQGGGQRSGDGASFAPSPLFGWPSYDTQDQHS